MSFRESAHQIIINRFYWTILILYPLINSCSTKEANVVELVTKPSYPQEFSSIPDKSDDPKLITLASANEIIKEIKIGRNDPFLPPQINANELSIPNTFKYHGLLAAKDGVDAFVSYKDRTGTIKAGDVGGKNTDLLPTGWIVSNVYKDTSILVLSFEKNSIEIELFSTKDKN